MPPTSLRLQPIPLYCSAQSFQHCATFGHEGMGWIKAITGGRSKGTEFAAGSVAAQTFIQVHRLALMGIEVQAIQQTEVE